MNATSEGDRSRYRLEPKPLGRGGYAEVFRGEDKLTGLPIAFKRLHGTTGDSLPRMRREIEVQRVLAPHPNVMPVLDADDDGRWYVMPLAAGDLEKLRGDVDSDSALVEVLTQTGEAIAAAHALGFVHRDVTPRNILALDDDAERRWVVADWGLVRNPPGQTTTRYTKPGQVLGTEGFVAPELLRDAHEEASAAADVFSMGRVLAWAVTGTWPLAGGSLLPAGPFRQIVRAATHDDPSRRPALDELTAQLKSAVYTPQATIEERATALRAAAAGGDRDAALGLFEVASEQAGNADLYFDEIAEVRGDALNVLLEHEAMALDVIEAMHRHLTADDDRWGQRPFDHANEPLLWLHEVAMAAAQRGMFGIMEDAVMALVESEVVWRRFAQRRRTRSWFETLDGESAETAARCLRAHPEAVVWYLEERWVPSSGTHRSISEALGK